MGVGGSVGRSCWSCDGAISAKIRGERGGCTRVSCLDPELLLVFWKGKGKRKTTTTLMLWGCREDEEWRRGRGSKGAGPGTCRGMYIVISIGTYMQNYYQLEAGLSSTEEYTVDILRAIKH